MNFKKSVGKLIFLVINIALFIYFKFFNTANNLSETSQIAIIATLLANVVILFIYATISSKEKKSLNETLDVLSFVANVFSFLLIIVTFVLFRGRVTGNSMEPNFYQDDRVFALRTSKKLKKDDIVVYFDDDYIIKRVIATEGDKLSVDEENYIYLNGELIYANGHDEAYKFFGQDEGNLLKTLILANSNNLVLKEDEYIFFGDNLYASRDSRHKGIINEDDVVGKVFWWFKWKKSRG